MKRKNKKNNSLLWEITPKEGGRPSYLFGTMHVRDLRAFGWLEAAKHCLDRCEVFAAEFDFMEADPQALSSALELPEGLDLKQLLGPQCWKNLQRYTRDKLGADAESFRAQHPMSVSTALSMAFFMEEMAHSLDETLWQYAKASGKLTTGVETFADQLETLRLIPLETHVKGLTWMLKHFNRFKTRLQKMMRRYIDADIQSLYQSAKKDAKGMRKILLYRRNRLMTKRFSEIARQQTLFCAVGAGHLAGGKGMLRLLKKAGFKVKPVFM